MYQSDGSGASEVLEAEVRVRLERARAPHEDRGAARLLVERGGRLRARHHRLRVCAGVGARARRDPDEVMMMKRHTAILYFVFNSITVLHYAGRLLFTENASRVALCTVLRAVDTFSYGVRI